MTKIKLIITFCNHDSAEPLHSLFRRIFPACSICTEPGWEVLTPAPGVLLQLCGQAAQPPLFLRIAPQPITSYAVENLKQAIEISLSKGAKILQQANNDSPGFSFCYLLFPDGHVQGLFNK